MAEQSFEQPNPETSEEEILHSSPLETLKLEGESLQSNESTEPHEMLEAYRTFFEGVRNRVAEGTISVGQALELASNMTAQVQTERNKLVAEQEINLKTGMLNERGLKRQLEQIKSHASRKGEKVAFLFVDLDGDKFLRLFATYLQSKARGSDVAGHIQGDEFVILLVDGDVDGAEERFEELSSDMYEHMQVELLKEGIDISDMRVGMTVGGTEVTAEDTFETAFKRSDERVDEKKVAGYVGRGEERRK